MTAISPSRPLSGCVAIVTGGGKGIGEAIARRFARAGANLMLTSRTHADLERVADEARSLDVKAVALPGDLNDLEFIPRLLEETTTKLGRLDIIVNNAGGTTELGSLEDENVDHMNKSFHFNVSAPFELIRLALPHLRKQAGANVVNIGSITGTAAPKGQFVHSVTKAALAQMTRVAAADLAPDVRVNAVIPGAIDTHALASYFEDVGPGVREMMEQHTAMRRIGTAEDVAEATFFMASPAASWITGKLLEVDGNPS